MLKEAKQALEADLLVARQAQEDAQLKQNQVNQSQGTTAALTKKHCFEAQPAAETLFSSTTCSRSIDLKQNLQQKQCFEAEPAAKTLL